MLQDITQILLQDKALIPQLPEVLAPGGSQLTPSLGIFLLPPEVTALPEIIHLLTGSSHLMTDQ